MSNSAVIGLGFGDEGKGLVTNWLCLQNSNSFVTRFCGGHQAGHTVYKDNKKHVFSNFGSGTLQDNPTYWSKFCTIDPIGIKNEFLELKNNFSKLNPKLYINAKCPVVTPYDKIRNRSLESNNKHGSVGVGFGTTLQREEDHYSLLFEDLYFSNIVAIKLKLIRKYYNYDEENYFNLLLDFFEACEYITNLSNIQIVSDNYFSYNTSNVIFESSQGLMLDQNNGFFPHVTRSNVGINQARKVAFYINKNIEDVYYVTRAYQTRHGNGPMTNENLSYNIKEDSNETNVHNKYQGNFRKTILDLDLLKYVLMKEQSDTIKNKYLVITCLDHIENQYKFTLNKKIVECTNKKDFIEKISNILQFNNVYISESPYSESIIQII